MLLNALHPIEPFAFKEWALVCEALGSGDQSLLLRKGGIAEGKHGFGFEHTNFFLFPTWFHGQIEKIRSRNPSAIFSEASEVLTRIFHVDLLRNPGRLMDAALDSHFDLPHQASRLPHHDQYEISGLKLEYVASIEWNDFVTDRKKLSELAALHILHESVLEERFHYIDKHQKNAPGIHVAFVRMYRLDVPFQLQMEKRFGGCRSWVQLPKMRLGTLVSVLSDEEHLERRILLDAVVKNS